MSAHRILITGSQGFIGKTLQKRLVSHPRLYELFTLDRNGFGANHRTVDITSEKLDSAVIEINPATIIHLAGNVSLQFSIENPLADFNSNALGTLKLILSALKTQCQNFIYITSGGAIYDTSAALPVGETAVTNPVSPYGLSKSIGEEYLKLLADGQLNWTSLALSNCYGSVLEQKKGFIYSMWRDLSKGTRPKIYGPTVSRDFVYIRDVLDAIELAIETPTNRRINISSGRGITLIDLYSKITQLLDSNVEPEILPPSPKEVFESCLDNSLARDLLGWRPKVDIDEGLKLSLT